MKHLLLTIIIVTSVHEAAVAGWAVEFDGSSSRPVVHAVYRENLIVPTQTQFIWGQDPDPGHLYSLDAKSGK